MGLAHKEALYQLSSTFTFTYATQQFVKQQLKTFLLRCELTAALRDCYLLLLVE